MKTIITCSPGNSGGGAVHDYLLSRKDFLSPFLGEEFRLICDPYGLHNLYFNLFQNFSLNNSSEAFYNFRNYCYNLSKIKSADKLVYGKNFYKLSSKFIKNIEYLSYKGIPQFKSIDLDIKKKFFFKLKKKLLNYQNYQHGYYEMKIPINEKKFLKESKKFLNELFNQNIKLKKNKNIVLDQSTNFWKPDIIFKYIENSYIIIVTRDPRSVFYSMKFRGSFAYPGYDIKKFVDWYKYIMEAKITIPKKFKKRIIKIRFEDFINNFNHETKKINNFLGLKYSNANNFDYETSKINVLKAKKNLNNFELKYIEKKLKNYLQW